MSSLYIQKLKKPIDRAFRRSGSGLFVLLLFQAYNLAALPSVALAADNKPQISASDLTDILRQPDVGAKATNLQVVGTGPEVTVLAQCGSAHSDRDLKIDAIFLAKALFQNASGQINRVKVLFSQAGHDGRYININDKQIFEYGSGKMTAEQFLSVLRLITVDSERAPDVVQGPQFERRLLAWQRIEKLRKQGTGVEPFETIFAEIDAGVKTGKEDPGKKLSFLEAKLSDQEEAIRQAQRTARGLGVPASKISISETNSGNGNGPNSGAKNQIPASQYLPPEHDYIKQVFQRRADEMISLVRSKNRAASEKLSTLKKDAETAFQQNRQSEAFAYIHQFHTLSQQETSVDMFKPEGGGPGGPNSHGSPDIESGPNGQGGPNRQGGGPSGGPSGGPGRIPNGGSGGGPSGGPGGGPNGPGGGPQD